MADRLPVDTTQIRLYLLREPVKTRGAARLIRTLCDEIDRLRRELAKEAVR